MNSHSLLDSNFVDKSAPLELFHNRQQRTVSDLFSKVSAPVYFFDDTRKFDVDLNRGKTQNVNFDDTKK